jgi:ABC-type polysaccharide/polyol phosphate transport system ATPase subunit
MSEPAITVENLSKCYLIGHRSGEQARFKYTAFRDIIGRELRAFARKALDVVHGRQVVQGDEVEKFWALRNVSFQISHGEAIGIIGRNGAGKSTLLKVLSRITEPTEGRVLLQGRVTSLLEVGTGFHPELTGRENIYLNGAILGLSRREIRKKFDEIVAFAEVETFLDTPVKRYSSGMYTRLAFAVAAHLEPDILIVDEVLAVGDAEFQKKCFGKMGEASRREGRTVLFVSHNLAAISEMTNRTILLDAGSIVCDGPAADVISRYLSRGSGQAIYVAPSSRRSKSPCVSRIEVHTSNQNAVHEFGKPLEMKFWIRHDKPKSWGCFHVQIYNQYQHPVIHAYAFNPSVKFGTVVGETVLTCRFPAPRLNVGKFHLRTYLSEPPSEEIYEMLDGLCPFEIVRTGETVLWGWHRGPSVCCYHEECSWSVAESAV